MFKNAAKLSVMRSEGTRPEENMGWRSNAKADTNRSPKETNSVPMEHQRIHEGKECWHLFDGLDGNERLTTSQSRKSLDIRILYPVSIRVA